MTSHIGTLGKEVCHQLQKSAQTLLAMRVDTLDKASGETHTEQDNPSRCAVLLEKNSKLEAAIGASDRHII